MSFETCKLQPQTLIQGMNYLLSMGNPINPGHHTAIVEFVDYDPCPAIVIVRTSDGGKLRCQRSSLLCANGMRG